MKTSHPTCNECVLARRGGFCSLLESNVDRLDREKAVQHYSRGQVVLYEDHVPLALYCITSGRVKIHKTGPKGEEQIIRLLDAGEFFGYRPLLAGEPYSAAAKTVQPSVLCVIPKETVLGLIQESSDFAMKLLAHLAKEMRLSEEQMFMRTQESAHERTAGVLCMLHQRGALASSQGPRAGSPLKRAEIAQLIGVSPETLSRSLRFFADRNLIRLSRNEIVIVDLNGLHRLAHTFDARS